MASDPVLNSRTYGFSVRAPETLDDPISKALASVPVSPPRQRAIEAGPSSSSQEGGVVALAPPTKTIEIIGGRARFVDDEDIDTIVATWLDVEKDPSDVKLIDLSLNKITDRGIQRLASAIGERPGQLEDLDIDSNNLGDESLKAIAAHLVANPAVKIARMDLSTNNFTDLGVVEFVSALRAQKSQLPLRTLLLRQCNLTNTALRALCDWLSDAECPLTALHISGNDFTELDGIKWVAEAIKSNTKLIDLNVSNCFDYVARWDSITDAVTANTTLRAFNIAVMGKKAEAVATLDAHLKENKKRALSEIGEIGLLKAAHAKEIDRMQAQFRVREGKLEARIVELMAEVERLKHPGKEEEEL